MKIGYERSGGFAGLRISFELDLDDLPEEQSKTLRDLLDEADFDDLPAQILPARPGADQFSYRITVHGRHGLRSVETTDSAAPETLRQLLAQLNQLARTRMRH